MVSQDPGLGPGVWVRVRGMIRLPISRRASSTHDAFKGQARGKLCCEEGSGLIASRRIAAWLLISLRAAQSRACCLLPAACWPRASLAARLTCTTQCTSQCAHRVHDCQQEGACHNIYVSLILPTSSSTILLARLPTSHMHARIHDVHAWCICILHACMCTYECMPTPSSFSSSSRQRAAEPTSAALSAVLASERALARAWRG